MRGLCVPAWALCLALVATGCDAATLSPFTTDGCSRFPDGTPAQQTLWQGCCVRHDLAYWIGGTEADRLEADQALRQCVAAVGEPSIAALMLAGVRVGGSPYFPTAYRWGYGWPYPRGYGELSGDEVAQLNVLRRAVPALNGAALKQLPAIHRLLQRHGMLLPDERSPDVPASAIGPRLP